MRALTFTLIVIQIFFLTLNSDAQVRQTQNSYLDRAEIRHSSGTATILANDPRPLAQAGIGLAEEYGWPIDFEDPPYYSKYDLLDDSAAHPNAKGFTLVSGGAFQAQFPEPADEIAPATERQRILNQVISDYNQTTNPGRFAVRDEGNGRFSIVPISARDESGQDKAVNPILDTPISISTDTRNAFATVEIIAQALTAQSHTQVTVGAMANNALLQSKVTVGGQNVPARDLLLQAISASWTKLCWHLYYDYDEKAYFLNVVPLHKAHYDASGNRTTELVH